MGTLGENIKAARLKKGYTQKQLADMIGAKHNSISNWENDQNKPDPDMIDQLSGALGESVDYLLYGYEKKLFVQLVNYIRNNRTIERFAEDSGVDVKELAKICLGLSFERPSIDLIQRIIKDNPIDFVRYEDLLSAAGYPSHYSSNIDGALKVAEPPGTYSTNKVTLAASRTDGYDEDLPDEAIEEINQYIEFIKHKYRKKGLDDKAR